MSTEPIRLPSGARNRNPCIQTAVAERIDEARAEATLRKAFREWCKAHEQATKVPASALETRFPVSSEIAAAAMVELSVAQVRHRAAELTLSATERRLADARARAILEIEAHEVTPEDGDWEPSPFRLALRAAVRAQSLSEVFQVVETMAARWTPDQLAAAVRGNLGPFVRERVGPVAPTNFYQDMAAFLDVYGEAGRKQVLETIREGPAKLAPLLHLASLLSSQTRVAPC